MELVEIKTLIDITNTRVVRLNQGSQLELDQNRNFITLVQCAELRSVIHYDVRPICETVDINDIGFGSAYRGQHCVWSFHFSPDRSRVYESNNEPLGFLINDLQGVPIIKKLTETINIDKAVFELKDNRYKNTIIMALSGTH